MNPPLELAIVREALQMRLLVELMSNALQKELVLKGGMAMRTLGESVRYTKDIDLDVDPKFSKARVQGIVRRSIQNAINSGLIEKADISEPKQTETTLRWKISGNQPNSDAPLHLTVEVSRREPLTDGHIIEVLLPESLAGGARDAKVQVLDHQAMVVTKVLALTDPLRMASRDLFDLHVLIEAQVSDPSSLLAKIPNAKDRLPQALLELWSKIEAMTYAMFKSDVIPYLPAQLANGIDEDTFNDMQLTVGTYVEKWLKSASGDAGESL